MNSLAPVPVMNPDVYKRQMVSHGALMNIAHLLDHGMPLNGMGSATKIYASQTASWVASKAVEVLGGYGYRCV